MAFRINIGSVSGVREKGEKFIKVSFRGVSYSTQIYEQITATEELTIDESFHWPIGSPIASEEILRIQLINHSRYLSNKVVGNYGLVLQKVIEDGVLRINDHFTDINNSPLPFKISFEAYYMAPELVVLDEDKEPGEQIALDLGDETQQLYPRSPKKRNSSPKERSGTSSLPATVKSIATFMKLGKKTGEKEGLTSGLTKGTAGVSFEYGSTLTFGSGVGGGDVFLGLDDDFRDGSPVNLLISDTTSSIVGQNLSSGREEGGQAPYSITTPVIIKRLKDVQETGSNFLKPQDYQVCVTVIEARHLIGLNMDPVICVQVGDQKKYTSVKESTNCPYYNEYMVFDFHMQPSMLFDKLITVTVLHSRNLLRAGKVIGSFKLDVGTVFSQNDHQFYHKWALLTDPDDVFSGAKGYVKCDILVAGKGDTVKPNPPKSGDSDDDDIEGNLLLPRGVPSERQHARYIVKVYRADGLPRSSGLMSNVKKAFTSGSRTHLIDPYVVVHFAGLTGRTAVIKSSCSPAWNQQIIFTEMFPPLCQRIKIQIRDNDPVNDNVIATHFLHLSKICNDGEKGFLPSFGPSFVHLYGSPRDSSLIFNDQSQLNDGFAEGVSYRGRLLVSVKTQILDSIDNNLSDVSTEPIAPINETVFGKTEEFLLFASIFESNMIDRKYSEKQISYEITIGNDGQPGEATASEYLDIAGDTSPTRSESERLTLLPSMSRGYVAPGYECRSTTTPIRPMICDRQYYFLPIELEKPCVYLKTTWPDHRRRLYNSNIMQRIAETLETGVADVEEMVRLERQHADRRLRGVLEELAIGCNRFANLIKGSGGPSGGKTRLDKERVKLCQRELEQIANQAKATKPLITGNNTRDKLKTVNQLLAKVKDLVEDPQQGLPDIFIWMLASGKRIAYQKLSARSYIFSTIEEEMGTICGKVHNLFLKLAGKKNEESNWLIQNKLQAYIWLGHIKHKKFFPKGLTKGYKVSEEIRNAEKANIMPPISLQYEEKHLFELRAHMYQARSLIASDSSGLSDPFAKVIFADCVQTTQVIEETLSPTWDEMLLFSEVTLYGNRVDLLNDPPTVVVEVYDQDKMVFEYIGRSFARAYVRFSDQLYSCPQLQWFDIRRGDEQAGQLLAAFELIQLKPQDNRAQYPALLPSIKVVGGDRNEVKTCSVYPVPPLIRPTLSKYRIEVLFWGLRDLKRVHFMSVDRPRVDVECSGHILSSSVILNYRRNPNFQIPVKHMDLLLPDQELYCPPLTIRVMDCRSFGRFTLVGTHVIGSLSRYQWKETNLNQEIQLTATKFLEIWVDPRTVLPSNQFQLNSKQIKTNANKKKKQQLTDANDMELQSMVDDEDPDAVDWWSRYFASLETMINEKAQLTLEMMRAAGDLSQNSVYMSPVQSERGRKRSGKSPGTSPRRQSPKNSPGVIPKEMLIKIYPCELEAEYNGFTEWLNSFDLFRGKRSSNEDENKNLVGFFKGSIQLYKHPLPSCQPFEGIPSNDPIHVLVRIYVVKANDLHPQDLNGKADPYVVILLGNKRVSDKENYISKQLNPIFGKCFEFEAQFPMDSLLTVQVYDWDLLGSDDLIGETKIDLENRYYSHHRATCGLPRIYETTGPNQWRDNLKPTQILSKLCKDLKIAGPVLYRNRVKVGNITFNLNHLSPGTCTGPVLGTTPGAGPPSDGSVAGSFSGSCFLNEEQLALGVLNNWEKAFQYNLIPEHVESRALYNPDKPGIEQGSLEMWIDLFPLDSPQQPPPPTDISPRKPKSYELRVIIWNTDEVVLEDDAFFTGEKMSDIYVKGWLKGNLDDNQCTDIHYRSLTGEGNFNWRFVYPFDYLPAEEKIVISRKESLFSWDESEMKMPARLHLQVWDADHFSADDFLGAITLDLNRFPRGAKSAKLCGLQMLKGADTVPMVSLFKQKRIKGWWPFYVKKENEEMELTGKVEAELQLLTKEEAERNPAGCGRNEPDPLDKPNRPDSSFLFLLNPLKSLKYVIWHNYKWMVIKALLFVLLVLFLALFVYSLPGYTVKKIIGA